jgi:hypothetical protein
VGNLGQKQHSQPHDPLMITSSFLFAKQPNFCFAKLNKMALQPLKISDSKFGFPIPRRVFLKPRCSQNIFFNLSLAFPFGSIPIFRPALELLNQKNSNDWQILNSQDGSTCVSNLIMRVTNNSRLPVSFNRGTILATVLVKNSMHNLYPLKVKRISYDISDSNKMGMVLIHHE